MTESEALFDAARDGDLDAFSQLVEPHRGRLMALAHLRLDAKQRARVDPKDLVQDTFLRALEALPRFEWNGDKRFAAWLTTIAKNQIRTTYRRHHGDDKQLETRAEGEAKDTNGSRASPLRMLQREERFDRLTDALRKLPDDYREVLILARIEQKRVADIAREINRSPNATSMLILRSLRALREAFGETESLRLPPWALR